MCVLAQVKVTVEIDPEICELSEANMAKLEKGLRASCCYRGVRFDGLSMNAHVFKTCAEVVMQLHRLADQEIHWSLLSGGLDTATGRHYNDRAMFFKLAAKAIFDHRFYLWNE